MNQDLINRAQELRNHGFTTGEIADELNVSMDTAQWLTLQRGTPAETEAPVDIAINWNSLGGSATRLRYVSAALSDIALKHGDIDLVVGIATSRGSFAWTLRIPPSLDRCVLGLAILTPTALAQSMLEPPPKPIMQSHLLSLYMASASSTVSVVGLATVLS